MGEWQPLKCWGTGRDGENPKALSLSFNRAPTDDELRMIDEAIKYAVDRANSLITPSPTALENADD